MIGKATIRLYDKKHKLLHKAVEYNSVTNGVKNLLNQNYTVDAISENSDNVINAYTPIWKNFAGLLLFNDELNDETIIPDKKALSAFTGQGTDTAHYDISNLYHGRLSASESEFTKDYCKFVFDFPETHVPGTISAIGLTSIQGGNNGLQGGSGSLFVSYSDLNLQEGNACGVGLDVPSANFVPYIKESIDGIPLGVTEDGNLLVCKLQSSGVNGGFNVKSYKIEYKVNLTQTFQRIRSQQDYETFYGSSLDNVPLFQLEKTYFISNQNTGAIGGDELTIDDMRRATLIGNCIYVPIISGFSSTVGDFKMFKFELKSDGTVEQHKITTNLQIDVTNGDYRCTNNMLYVTTGNYLYIVNIGEYDDTIHENPSYDKIQLVENNVTPLIFKDTIALMNTGAVTNNSQRNIYFLTNSNILAQNKVIFQGSCDKIINFTFNFNEPVFGIITETNGVATINTNVFTAFLGTINNITPIIKYSTVDMTVTYELYTEDYVEPSNDTSGSYEIEDNYDNNN